MTATMTRPGAAVGMFVPESPFQERPRRAEVLLHYADDRVARVEMDSVDVQISYRNDFDDLGPYSFGNPVRVYEMGRRQTELTLTSYGTTTFHMPQQAGGGQPRPAAAGGKGARVTACAVDETASAQKLAGVFGSPQWKASVAQLKEQVGRLREQMEASQTLAGDDDGRDDGGVDGRPWHERNLERGLWLS